MSTLTKSLSDIQATLKAPKGQTNKFGGYKYRSCEDILEAVKPLLSKHKVVLTISDSVEAVGDRVYIKATAKLSNGTDDAVETHGFAREEEVKKGMDSSQITGSASSYARKYALNGLFCIDDTKDSDATNSHGKAAAPSPSQSPQPKDEFKSTIDWLSRQGDKGLAWQKIEKQASSKFSAKQLGELQEIVKAG